MQTLQQKLVQAAGYSEKGAQSAVERLERIKGGLPPEKVQVSEMLLTSGEFLPQKERIKCVDHAHSLSSPPRPVSSKPIIPTKTAFNPIVDESVEMIQARFAINPPRNLSWRESF